MIIFTDINKNYKELYLVNAICICLLNNYINFILYNNNTYYYYEEFKKFKDYYIKDYYKCKLTYIVYLNYSTYYHREDGPVIIWYNTNGEIYDKEYYLNGIKYSYYEYILKIKDVV